MNPTTGWPTNWWSADDVNLGDPSSPKGHYQWNGLFRRDFKRGMVLVNQLGSPPTTVDLGGSYQRLDGTLVTQVTINPSDGAVLIR